jgi:hypothetical protein
MMLSSLLVLLTVAANEPAALVQRMSFVVKVSEPVRAADDLVAQVEKLEGYFSSRTDSTLVLRVPTRAVDQLAKAIEKSGVVVSRDEAANDVASSLLQMRTLLESRRTMLERYMSVLGGADLSAVVTVEREITGLVQEIEQVAGQLRALEHSLQLAEVRVDYRFPDRRPPLRQGQSSFAWLNSVDLVALLGAFANASN